MRPLTLGTPRTPRAVLLHDHRDGPSPAARRPGGGTRHV